MRGERGVALVQVLVMSVVLILFATGVLEIIFGTHVLYSRVRTSEEDKSWAQACMAETHKDWQGDPCRIASSLSERCDYTGLPIPGPVVEIACSSNKVTFTVDLEELR